MVLLQAAGPLPVDDRLREESGLTAVAAGKARATRRRDEEEDEDEDSESSSEGDSDSESDSESRSSSPDEGDEDEDTTANTRSGGSSGEQGASADDGDGDGDGDGAESSDSGAEEAEEEKAAGPLILPADDAAADGPSCWTEAGLPIRSRSCLIFCATVEQCQLVAETLAELGWLALPLHSALPQFRRDSALQRFRSGRVPLLVATDVAARGLDIPEVDLVVNVDCPRNAADYVHRVGRTARAGRGGCAVTLVTERDVGLVHSVEAALGHRLSRCTWLTGDWAEDAVAARMSKVSKASRVARLRIAEKGFEDRLARHSRRKQGASGRTKRAMQAHGGGK